MEFFLFIIIGVIVVNFDKFNKEKQEKQQEEQDFPIKDRKYTKKEIGKFIFIVILHYMILIFVFAFLIEFSNTILKLIGHGVDLSYEIRNYYARIASIIITVLRIPKLKRINLDNEK